MTAIIKHLALLSEAQSVKAGDVMKVAAALQKQATRDLGPIWEVSATVDAFEKLEDVPLDYWPMIVKDDIGMDGASGVHLDKNGQPFALITASDDIDEWSLTASHETVEMLVDPFGDKLKAGDSPKADQGRVLFLVEVSDPSEAKEFAYTVNGVLVSDFYTPNFFDPITASGVRYSFVGAIKKPRQVLARGLSELEGRDHRHLVAGDLVLRVGIAIQEPGQADRPARRIPRGDRPPHGEGHCEGPGRQPRSGQAGGLPRPAWHVDRHQGLGAQGEISALMGKGRPPGSWRRWQALGSW